MSLYFCILFSFLIGCTPIGIHDVILRQYGEITNCATILKIHITRTYALISVRLSEALNPLIYMLGCRKLRNEIRKVLGMKVHRQNRLKLNLTHKMHIKTVTSAKTV